MYIGGRLFVSGRDADANYRPENYQVMYTEMSVFEKFCRL